MTENIPKYAGVVYFSMNDTCLGIFITNLKDLVLPLEVLLNVKI
jgi:hypothetical protein